MPIPDRLALYRVHPESKSGGGSLLKARDYVRFADEFLADSGLPGAAEGRGARTSRPATTSTTRASSREARRALLASLRLKPTTRGAGLLARTLARSVLP